MSNRPPRKQRAPSNVTGARPRAPTIDDQWQRVEYWHQTMAAEKGEPDSLLQAMSEAWDTCSRNLSGEGSAPQSRGRELIDTGDTPLAAMTYFIEMGSYPPPELLLAFADTWRAYMEARGALSLEDVFLGRPRKSSGNYAKRKGSKYRQFWITWELTRLTREGYSRIEAAEIISQALGGKPDADSILRITRGVGNPRRKQNFRQENNPV